MQKTTNLLWLVLLFLFLLVQFEVQAKPSAPLDIEIQALQTAQGGSATEFLLIIRAEGPFDSLMLHVSGADATVWHSGNTNWQGSLDPGQEKRLQISATLPLNGFIKATITAKVPNFPDIVVSETYQLPSASNYKGFGASSGIAASRTSRSWVRGQAVLEYVLD